MLNSQTSPESVQEILPHGTMTMEEFLENDLEGYEYVKGELVPMAAAAIVHGEVGSNVHLLLGLYVRENKLGRLYIAETTFQLRDRVVKPDVAFVSTERLSEEKLKGFSVAPDLAIEIVSPSDKHYDVTEKALAYLKAGTQLVWVIEPIMKTVTVYRSETDSTLLNYEDTLTGEDVVEGFSCPVAELFE
ncbi:MAG: Uma2 family endonuclease [Candidatus Poribacteria bacterium]|nr:Uma2 family endonuclease [Candidatus Poribacteria bacterium]